MSEPKVYFCRKCGARIVMGDKFCSGCGDKLDWRPSVANDDSETANPTVMHTENILGVQPINLIDGGGDKSFDTSSVPANKEKNPSINRLPRIIAFCAVVAIITIINAKLSVNKIVYTGDDIRKAQQEDSINQNALPENKNENPDHDAAPAETQNSINSDSYIDVPYEIDPNDPHSAALKKKYQELTDFEFDDFLSVESVRRKCEKNTAVFCNDYGGRRICVCGTLESVSASYGNTKLNIECDSASENDSYNLFSVICTLSDEVEQPYLADIESGYYVAVVGQIDTDYITSGAVHLDDCVIYDFENSFGYYSDEYVQ